MREAPSSGTRGNGPADGSGGTRGDGSADGGTGVTKARAAVLRRRGGPFRIEEVTVADPGPGEVLVRCVATGVCHTDLLAVDGVLPPASPVVLGHEGSGHVAAVGPGVAGLAVGDPVVLSPAACRTCRTCVGGHPMLCERFLPLNLAGARPDGTSAYQDADGQRLNGHFFGQSSFASYVVVGAHSAVPVDPAAPLALLGPLGCGFQTGAGAVLNVLGPAEGETLVVIGVGAVGLAAVLAAAIRRCGRIVAVDRNPERLKLALDLGATHAVDAATDDLPTAIAKTADGRVDCVLDAVGTSATARTAIEATGFGGRIAIAGSHGAGAELTVGLSAVFGRTIHGVSQGDSTPAEFIPQLVAHHRAGRFPIDRLIRSYPLAEIGRAVADAKAGRTVKPVLLH
ncbi:alcohol dehydrogenase [Streptomyces griseocarneus]|nr:alcohol dehydrogenase [Streptomyces griseocarneus]